ncbi:hypothetical protein OAG94_00320 [bacterium]|nr:hypothetical protein [bacterium]
MKLNTIFSLGLLAGAFTLPQSKAIAQDPVKQDSTASKQAADASFEQRMKLAQRPFSFLSFDYMEVTKGKEKLYLEVEAAWQKIHKKMAADGKILSWGIAKARKNKFDYDYVTWKLLRSRGALDNLYDMDAIKESMGEGEFDELMAKTTESRRIVGSELMELEDYTLVPLTETGQKVDPKNLLFHMDYMTPAQGKEHEYAELERNIFQPRHQKSSELNPKFQYWRMLRKISHSGKANEATYRTVNVFRKDVEALSDKEIQKMNSQIPALPDGLTFDDVMKMRKMERVTFDVVLMLDPSASAEAREWQKLQGSWKHTNQNGSYRIKRISPYREVLENYSKDGIKQGSNVSPMKIEIKNGLKFFYSIHPNGIWRSIYHIKDGKWYEQLRGIFGETNAKPNEFLIYDKIN